MQLQVQAKQQDSESMDVVKRSSLVVSAKKTNKSLAAIGESPINLTQFTKVEQLSYCSKKLMFFLTNHHYHFSNYAQLSIPSNSISPGQPSKVSSKPIKSTQILAPFFYQFLTPQIALAIAFSKFPFSFSHRHHVLLPYSNVNLTQRRYILSIIFLTKTFFHEATHHIL